MYIGTSVVYQTKYFVLRPLTDAGYWGCAQGVTMYVIRAYRGAP